MFSHRTTTKSGFTLPEVLVTVAIVAVLAAIVVPTVTSQITKGDEANFTTGTTNIRTGITAFVSDTRRWPGRVSDLYNAPVAGDLDLFGVAYGAPTVARWKGPYVSGALQPTDSLFVALAHVHNALLDSTLAAAGSSGYVIASLSGVTTQAAAARLDTLIDGSTGYDAGVLQWQPNAGAIAQRAVKLQIMGSR
jgi:prepilin-type N-terminal cleavage/methylation domain-containing protein